MGNPVAVAIRASEMDAGVIVVYHHDELKEKEVWVVIATSILHSDGAFTSGIFGADQPVIARRSAENESIHGQYHSSHKFIAELQQHAVTLPYVSLLWK